MEVDGFDIFRADRDQTASDKTRGGGCMLITQLPNKANSNSKSIKTKWIRVITTNLVNYVVAPVSSLPHNPSSVITQTDA